MPGTIELESTTNFFVVAAWVAGAVTIAYALGLVLSWLLQRIGRRSAVLRDVAQLTRRPVRATFMVIAASAALRRASDATASWRGWLDHALVILLIGALTWMVASLVVVAERQVIAKFAGGGAGLTDADRHRRKIRTQVTVLRRLVIAVFVVLGGAAALMTAGPCSHRPACCRSSRAWPRRPHWARCSRASRSPSRMRSGSVTSSCSKTSGAGSRRSR